VGRKAGGGYPKTSPFPRVKGYAQSVLDRKWGQYKRKSALGRKGDLTSGAEKRQLALSPKKFSSQLARILAGRKKSDFNGSPGNKQCVVLKERKSTRQSDRDTYDGNGRKREDSTESPKKEKSATKSPERSGQTHYLYKRGEGAETKSTKDPEKKPAIKDWGRGIKKGGGTLTITALGDRRKKNGRRQKGRGNKILFCEKEQ